MFESADPESREQNATDKRFFWMALYVQPVLWVVLAVFALIGLKFIWLTLVGELVSVWGGFGTGWVMEWEWEWVANRMQSLRLFLRSRIRWHSHDATSSVKRAALRRMRYMARVLCAMLRAAWSATGSGDESTEAGYSGRHGDHEHHVEPVVTVKVGMAHTSARRFGTGKICHRDILYRASY